MASKQRPGIVILEISRINIGERRPFYLFKVLPVVDVSAGLISASSCQPASISAAVCCKRPRFQTIKRAIVSQLQVQPPVWEGSVLCSLERQRGGRGSCLGGREQAENSCLLFSAVVFQLFNSSFC